MKAYLLIIFFLIKVSAISQVVDNFDDGDFSNSPTWNGNDSDFNVNTSGQLQLNADVAGNSFLSVPANLSSLDSCEWDFFIQLDFSPSTSNYCRVYLSSDHPDFQQTNNGYYLQFGESLSNDAIELFRQNGIVKTSICRAQNGLIANSFSAGIKVQRNHSGLWRLLVDYNGGKNYSLEAMGTDTTINNAGWIGVNCAYTSGNIQKFFFDNFYAGHVIPDTILPELIELNVESDSILSLIFSEAIDSISLYDVNNYSVDNGIFHPFFIEQDSSDLLKYFIHFLTPFQSGIDYTISISGLKDLSQNYIINQNRNFNFSPTTVAGEDDIVFSEIYFEPKSTSPLPFAEYIELYNRSDSTIAINGWKISDSGSDGLIPSFRLGPHEYIILCSVSDSLEFLSIPNVKMVHSFPTLNNDVGDNLMLTDQNDLLICELNFSDELYNDPRKDDGGWSLERIDPDFTCVNAKNWKASISNLHGTPGLINSIDGEFTDQVSPYAINAFLTDSNNLTIVLSESSFDGAADVNNYNLKNESGLEFHPASASSKEDTIELQFTSPLPKGIYTIRILPSLKDCSGNEFESEHLLKVGYPENENKNDILINELLFNCKDGGNDFVELYNRSSKVIDLGGWIIEETDYDDSTDVKETSFITKGHRLIFPGEYLILSEDQNKIRTFYYCENSFAFLNVNSMPDFNSTIGRVIIYDDEGNLIDEVPYDEEMHFPLLSDKKGVSLERLTTEVVEIKNIGWHSAAATSGFATPGYRNSQHVVHASGGGEISLGMEIFSPDDDGYNDVLCVSYRFPQNGTMLSLNVYDCNGKSVRTLLSGATIGNEGVIFWDGLTEDHRIADSGIYILLAKSFDLDGNDRVFKKACFLTRK